MQLWRDASTGTLKLMMLKPICTHQHVRRGRMLTLTVPMVAKRFRAAIIMPNTKPPITTLDMVEAYRTEIHRATGEDTFIPMMTLYLTDRLEPEEVERSGYFAVKYYPRGLTTNSDDGVADPASLWTLGTKPYDVLRAIAETGRVLIVHAADGFARSNCAIDNTSYTAGEELDPYHQEQHFFMETLTRIIDAHPKLKIEVAHLSTADGAEFMRCHGNKRLGASLTAHHLLTDRRDVMRGGFRPHLDWRPVVQSKEHTSELQRLVSGGHSFIWLGMDSAPHPRRAKEAPCCATGVLTAHAGIELYAEAFDRMNALDQRFEDFASLNAETFYDLPSTRQTITLQNTRWRVMSSYFSDEPDEEIVPFRLGETIEWQLAA